jgi:hypothetical protein
MSKLTREVIERALEERDMTPILAVGTIVVKEMLESGKCIVGFNCLDELQIALGSVNDILLPKELQGLTPTQLAQALVDLGLRDEKILEIMEMV